jgi:hypothetical protein
LSAFQVISRALQLAPGSRLFSDDHGPLGVTEVASRFLTLPRPRVRVARCRPGVGTAATAEPRLASGSGLSRSRGFLPCRSGTCVRHGRDRPPTDGPLRGMLRAPSHSEGLPAQGHSVAGTWAGRVTTSVTSGCPELRQSPSWYARAAAHLSTWAPRANPGTSKGACRNRADRGFSTLSESRCPRAGHRAFPPNSPEDPGCRRSTIPDHSCAGQGPRMRIGLHPVRDGPGDRLGQMVQVVHLRWEAAGHISKASLGESHPGASCAREYAEPEPSHLFESTGRVERTPPSGGSLLSRTGSPTIALVIEKCLSAVRMRL